MPDLDLTELDHLQSRLAEMSGPMREGLHACGLMYLGEQFTQYPLTVRTGTLLAVLDPSLPDAPGRLFDQVSGSLQVGFGGNARHPGGGNIATIACVQQARGRLLLQEPSDGLVGEMCGVMVGAVEESTK